MVRDITRSLIRTSKIFEITPKITFKSTDSAEFVKGTLYYAFKMKFITHTHNSSKILIFDTHYNYIVYSADIAKQYFDYIDDAPICSELADELLRGFSIYNHISLI